MSLAVDLRFERGGNAVHVSFQVPEAECLALVGPNGAGKSSVLWAIAGLIEPVQGHVRVGKPAISWLDHSTRVPPWRRSVGVAFQHPALFNHLSVIDNVAFGPRRRGASRSASQATASEALDRVGASSLANRPPGELSGGEARLVALARALATSPAVLLLDEPLAGLDVSVRARVSAVLHEVVTQFAGATVWVAHSLDGLRETCGHVAVLDEGKIVEQGPLGSTLAGARSPHLKAIRRALQPHRDEA